MSKSTKVLLIAVILIIVTVVIPSVFYRLNKKKDGCFEYEGYDLIGIDKISTIDPKLIIGSLERKVLLDIESPEAIAIDHEDNLYAAGAKECVVFNKEGTKVKQFDLSLPAHCITVNSDGNIYVGTKDHIEIYNQEGEQTAVWQSLGENGYITSIAADESQLFAADAGSRIVYRFDMLGNITDRIDGINPENDAKGFIVPSPHFDVALYDEDSLWIVNPGRHVLQNHTAAGRLKSSWGEFGSEVDKFCGCCNPADFTILSNGMFVTSEKGLVRVKLYGQDGTFKGVIAAPDDFASAVSGLDLAVDSDNKIYVLDPKAGMVKIFRIDRME